MATHLKVLKDQELLDSTHALVQKERAVTTEVLRHFQEIERRKLYAELKHGSLFEYAVRELGYSEGAASRRVQAMRLMTEIPEIESKIESGALNLSNICQAQGFFRDVKETQPGMPMERSQKKDILKKLEGKSAREGQQILFSIGAPRVLPRERERVVGPEHSEFTFLVSQELKGQLEEVRSLLGPRGARLGIAELVAEMARLSLVHLIEKRFGKKRVKQATHIDEVSADDPFAKPRDSDVGVSPHFSSARDPSKDNGGNSIFREPRRDGRYIPKATKYRVWRAAGGKCVACGSRYNLNFDHIRPFALGGDSSAENLQLLCHSCNIRRGVKVFGAHAMKRR